MRLSDSLGLSLALGLACACGMLWTMGAASLAGEGPTRTLPRMFHITREHRPFPMRGAPEFQAFVDQVGRDDRKDYARGVFITAEYDGNAQFPNARSDGYHVWYPDLRVGDIVPILGNVYRVTGMSGTSEPDLRGTSIGFLRLPDPEGPAVPAGVTVTKGTYAFPFGVSGGSRLHHAPFTASYVEESQSDGRKRPAARIQIQAHSAIVADPAKGKRKVERPGQVLTVRVGEILRFGELGHRVRNIVPPDSEKQVIGWIEIDQAVTQEAKPEK